MPMLAPPRRRETPNPSREPQQTPSDTALKIRQAGNLPSHTGGGGGEAASWRPSREVYQISPSPLHWRRETKMIQKVKIRRMKSRASPCEETRVRIHAQNQRDKGQMRRKGRCLLNPQTRLFIISSSVPKSPWYHKVGLQQLGISHRSYLLPSEHGVLFLPPSLRIINASP